MQSNDDIKLLENREEEEEEDDDDDEGKKLERSMTICYFLAESESN